MSSAASLISRCEVPNSVSLSVPGTLCWVSSEFGWGCYLHRVRISQVLFAQQWSLDKHCGFVAILT